MSIKLGEGRLLSGTPIDVSYQNEHTSFSAQQLEVSLEWLSCATVCLDISARKIDMHLKTRPTEPVPEQEKGEVNAPIHLGIKNFSVTQINASIDGQHIQLSQLKSSLNWRKERLHINNVELHAGKLSLLEQPSKPMVLPKVIPAIEVEVPNIPLSVIVTSVFVKQFDVIQGEQATQLGNLSAYAEVNSSSAKWQIFDAVISSSAILDGDLAKMQLHSNGSIDWSNNWQIQSNSALEVAHSQLSLNTSGPLSQLQVSFHSKGAYQSAVNGEFNLTQNNWPFDVKLNAQQLKFENVLTAPLERLTVDQLSLQAKGTLDDYALTLNTTGSSETNSVFVIKSRLQGSLSGVAIKNTQFRWRDSEANLSAHVDWRSGVTAKINGQIDKIPLILLSPKYENTQLGANIVATVAIDEEQWQTDVQRFELNGYLSDKPVNTTAKFSINQDLEGELSRLELDYGSNKLTMSGKLGKQLKLNGRLILAHSADTFLPVDAKMDAEFVLNGSSQTPEIAINANVKSLRYKDFLLNNAIVDLTSNSALNWQTYASIQAGKVSYDTTIVEDIDASLQGDLAKHTFAITSHGDIAAAVHLNGAWRNQQWQGQVSSATVSYLQQSMSLVTPASMIVSQSEAQFDKQCWKVFDSRACISAKQNFSSGDGLANIELSQLMLKDFNPWLKNVATLEGIASGELFVDWRSGQLNQADGQLKLQQAKVTTKEGERAHTLPIENLTATLGSTRELASINWQVNSSMLGRLSGQVAMPLTGIGQPSGSVEIIHMSLSPLSAILSKSLKQPIELSGDISGQLDLHGNLRSPTISGQISARDIAMQSAMSPVALVSSSVDIALNDKNADIKGELQALQGGTLSLDGQVSWEGQPVASISAVGKDFLIAPQPNVEVSISPNLILKYQQNKAFLTGQLQVPFGRIEIQTLPAGVVQVSQDQVIVDAQQEKVSRSPIAYTIDLDVSVGDDFRVKAFGLDSYIAGQLDVTKLPASPLLASGELSLNEGRYSAFGQDLLIKTGLIGFNGALNRPYLNVRAIRNPEVTANDVEAGIELSGSISSPKFSIYSQPAMDQSQALAYLLNGEPIGEGDNANSTVLTQLLLAQGLNRSEGLVSKTGEKLGFKDVSLSARGSGESTKVEVSGYLTPNVQVSYRVGVFDSLSEVAIRYRVFSKLYVEATSGLYDSIDLLYKFDWEPKSQ
ncbi:translocation/assembly module TamB domain-containing protein [Pseudoalteromonas sp. A25]|uniref:translocation/assembly module TamB domain-containing protein n=1 Tax=Pseudoalteromonas sp. A25 TaxID=116092 RepID=UPI0015621713|nr:translocation/assembly module TamB domain-containing protein [Pseudoalteromonas sp. A25]